MKKEHISSIISILAGCFLIAASIIAAGIPRPMNGIFLGVGAALIGISGSKLLLSVYYREHPTEERRAQIDDHDERTLQIRDKAKARAFDLTMSIFPILFVLLILVNTPLWLTLGVVLVYVIGYSTQFFWLGRFQREM
jgi:hypothetical protein